MSFQIFHEVAISDTQIASAMAEDDDLAVTILLAISEMVEVSDLHAALADLHDEALAEIRTFAANLTAALAQAGSKADPL